MAPTSKAMRKAADHLVAVDPAFGPIVESSPLCNIGRKKYEGRSYFSTLVTSVIAQQLSVKAADTITVRVTTSLGGNITPLSVVQASDADLRTAGLSGAKTRTIKGLAEAVHSGDLDLDAAAAHSEDQHIVTELTRLWGIGRWTAEMFLMFTLHRLDVWPVGDLAMRKGWQQIHGNNGDIAEKQIDPLGDQFRPYRSVAAWYCWRVIDGDSETW